jgi:hypothetical protein
MLLNYHQVSCKTQCYINHINTKTIRNRTPIYKHTKNTILKMIIYNYLKHKSRLQSETRRRQRALLHLSNLCAHNAHRSANFKSTGGSCKFRRRRDQLTFHQICQEVCEKTRVYWTVLSLILVTSAPLVWWRPGKLFVWPAP